MIKPRLLTEQDREKVLEYVSDEPEMAVFITGDIEQFGMKDPVSVYAFENPDGSWDSIVLRFYANYVCYSPNDWFDAASVAEFIRDSTGNSFFGSINGKYQVIASLAGYLDELDMRSLNLAKCTHLKLDKVAPPPDGTAIRKLTPENYDELFALLGAMDEYRGLYSDKCAISLAKLQKSADEAHGCLTYGAFSDGVLVSTAATSAVSSESAMVVGVGTRNDMRGYGFATAVVAQLCKDAFDSGMKFLTLFYENPSAGRIYQRIGFEPAGRYAMLR